MAVLLDGVFVDAFWTLSGRLLVVISIDSIQNGCYDGVVPELAIDHTKAAEDNVYLGRAQRVVLASFNPEWAELHVKRTALLPRPCGYALTNLYAAVIDAHVHAGFARADAQEFTHFQCAPAPAPRSSWAGTGPQTSGSPHSPDSAHPLMSALLSTCSQLRCHVRKRSRPGMICGARGRDKEDRC